MSTAKMCDRIIEFADKECGRGATPEEIALAEHSLGVCFPVSYRRFLAEFGWGRFSHQETYGLGQDAPLHIDLVRNTITERSEIEPALPPYLVPVMNDGAGNHYCVDTSSVSNGESPIVFWDHEMKSDQIPVVVAFMFEEWLIGLLNRLSAV